MPAFDWGVMRRAFVAVAATGWLIAAFSMAIAQPSLSPDPGQNLVAVLDLEPVGAKRTESSAISDRLREELLNTGRFVLVNRDQMDSVLKEQALQQTGCTSSECAVQVGKILGVRKIIAGRLTRVDESLWLLAVILVDVETARTERAVSVSQEGKFLNLMTDGVEQLTAKLVGPAAPSNKYGARQPAKDTAAALKPPNSTSERDATT